jgi:hypothetical protein
LPPWAAAFERRVRRRSACGRCRRSRSRSCAAWPARRSES